MMLHRILFKLAEMEGKRVVNRLLNHLKAPLECQKKNLLQKINRSKYSEFGRKYNFASIKTINSFIKRVPISTYCDIKPYIDRVIEGKTSALFNRGEKIMMFALTSGTTEQCKYIPVTKGFLKEYKKGSFLWGLKLFYDHPGLLRRKILPIVSPYDEFFVKKGYPCGSISGLAAATMKRLARLLYILPYWVYSIPDPEAKYYTILRLAMAEPAIGLISTANPSTLIKIAHMADSCKEDIIRDIYDGTFYFDDRISAENKGKISRRLIKNTDRAEELENLAGKNERLYPKFFWKELESIATWKGGILGHYIDMLPDYFGEAAIRDIGLIASEGRMSIPYNDEGSGGILDITSQFFEFITEEDYRKPGQKTLLCHELEVGKNYYVILTNSAGFFRYDINDLIQVTEFVENTPVIKFLSKGRHISSLTGEKISEYQVTEAIHKSIHQLEVDLEYFTVSPAWDKIPYYAIIVEQDEWLETGKALKLIDFFDGFLMEQNYEYLNKRQTLRLEKPRIKIIKKGTFDKIKSQRIKQNQGRSEQYKHIYLNPQLDYHKEFTILEEIKG